MTAFLDSKPHYALLDGLRGVAALFVVWYHIFEGFAFVDGSLIETVNHGYLAVDFFFMLSGFVLSYAYDDRWGTRLNFASFLKRRLIRLHPMVLMGALTGVVFYLLQGSVRWDGTPVSWVWVVLAFVLSVLMLPVTPGSSADIRGNGEMFPLNGPSWSLFFEYIGNLFYALVMRRMSTRVLGIWTALLGASLAAFALSDISGYGFMGVGWTLDPMNFLGGSLRMLFPFSMGMLLARTFRPVKVRGVFWLCALLLGILFHVPYIAGTDPICYNGLFEMICVLLVFPILILLAASGSTTDKYSSRICRFLGDISYPLYITHYPVLYLFYSWLIENHYTTLAETGPVVALVLTGCLLLAYLALKLYDEPVRQWLQKRK